MGLMTDAGLRKIRAAKEDGGWITLDDADLLTVPADLARSLAARAGARRNFNALSGSKRKTLRFWIKSAKRPETRSRRIAQAAAMAAKNLKEGPWRKS